MSMASMHFDLKDVITLMIAAVGAALGIINTWFAVDQRRVRLRVVPKMARPVIDGEFGEAMGCIEVLNLSAFPVSISEIGFTLNGDPRKHSRCCVTQPITLDHKPFARTLQPRHALTGYFGFERLDSQIQRAYAMTECSEVFYGASPALKQIRRLARG